METTNSIATGKSFITVEEAEKIIFSQLREFGVERISVQNALGRVLAEVITADRDLPPYNRVAMDGIAIKYEAIKNGIRNFQIKGVQAAGEQPVEIKAYDECIEIMTGAALPCSTDTIVRYEDVIIENGEASIETTSIKKGQNIHYKGSDKQEAEALVPIHQIITPSIIASAASVGKSELLVKQLPKCIVVFTGDELVGIEQRPNAYQIRGSNSFCIKAVLKNYGIEADTIHLPDNEQLITKELSRCLDQYDILLLTGGISMGKYDYVPKILEQLSVKKLFHKVQQRPGKPFWFGHYNQKMIFAFPGNPVSTFLCLHRYFLPWLEACLDLPDKNFFAILDANIEFSPVLTYFLQVHLLLNNDGKLLAQCIKGNGSGDFSSLVGADAFIELPKDKSCFKKGEVFRIWPVNKNIL